MYKSKSPVSKNIKIKDRNDRRPVTACRSSSRRSRKSTCLGHSNILDLDDDEAAVDGGLYKETTRSTCEGKGKRKEASANAASKRTGMKA